MNVTALDKITHQIEFKIKKWKSVAQLSWYILEPMYTMVLNDYRVHILYHGIKSSIMPYKHNKPQFYA